MLSPQHPSLWEWYRYDRRISSFEHAVRRVAFGGLYTSYDILRLTMSEKTLQQ